MNIRHYTLRASESALWAIAAICLCTYAGSKWQTARAQSVAVATLETRWDSVRATPPDQSLWSAQRIERYHTASTAAADPVALLSVPGIGLSVAVFDGTTDAVLDAGVGRVQGTAYPGEAGNLALAGHRDGFFRGLKDIARGQDIVVRHDGGSDRYIVTELSVVDPADVSVLAPTRAASVTLITCYPFYHIGPAPQRFIVRAERADSATTF